MNLKDILIFHFEKYPEMEPVDSVKLIYQNEFGGGHLIKNKVQCFDYLIRELEVTPSNPAMPLTVPIGRGIVRVNLAAILEYRITPEELNEAFVRSAEEIKGNLDSFREKLEVLVDLTRKHKSAPFGEESLLNYLSEYERMGYPMVSHSEKYRETYAPAYRIVLEKYLIQKNS